MTGVPAVVTASDEFEDSGGERGWSLEEASRYQCA
jgi:hypothetical protein